MKNEAPHWQTCWWPLQGKIGVCGKPAVTEARFWQNGSQVSLHVCTQHRARAMLVEQRHQQGAA